MFRVEYLLKRDYLKDFFKFIMTKSLKLIIKISIVLGALGVLGLIIFILQKESIVYPVELIILSCLLYPLVILASKISFARSMKISYPNSEKTFTSYNFGEEKCEIMDMVDSEIKAQVMLVYTAFTRFVETPKYIYLFLSANSAYILPKESFTEGTPDDFVKFLNDKGIAKKER